MLRLLSLVALVPFALAIPMPAAAPASPCAQVHVIAARASTEAPGAGVIGSLVTLIQDNSKQTVSTASVDYPATLQNYASSVGQGDSALKTQLTNQASACPSQKIVLVGYSQGAQVVGDVIGGGGGGSLGAETAPVSSTVANRVNAVIQMGDPRHVVGKSFDVGTSTQNGLFPRGNDQQIPSNLQARFKSFCDTGDPFCASGNNVAAHLDYTQKYNQQALTFVLSQIGG